MRPLAVALCDLDASIVSGEFPVPAPVALGHEFVAEVVEVGDAVDAVAAGRPRRRAVPDLLRGVRPLPARPDRRLRERAAPFDVRLRRLRRRLGRRAQRPRARAVRRRDAGAAARRGRPGRGRERERQHPRRLAHGRAARSSAGPAPRCWSSAGGARSIALYAVNAALALGAAAVVYLDTDEARLRLAAELGAETVEGEPPHRTRAVPDHRQREPDARGARLRDPLDRAGRRLHERRDSCPSPRRPCRCSRCTRTASSSTPGA